MINVEPTQTRYLHVHHPEWGAEWLLQFPESILSVTGWVMDYQGIIPEWKPSGCGGLGYEWATDNAYLLEQERIKQTDLNQADKKFVEGISVSASIVPEDSSLSLSLALTNTSRQRFERVFCDGGCFQAVSPQFGGHNEIARTYVMTGGMMQSLDMFERTVLQRCTYHCDAADYNRPPTNDGEWFWGRSMMAPDYPAILGMVSVDGARAVAYGYEGATAVSANSDEHHHCMHSRPFFGDIEPGETVVRRGHILFGDRIDLLGSRLRGMLCP